MKYAAIGFILCAAIVLCFCAGVKMCADGFADQCTKLGKFSVHEKVFQCAPVIAEAAEQQEGK